MDKRILICGLGSMGKRRLKILKSLLPEAQICGVDPRQDRREEAGTQFGIPAGADFKTVFGTYTPNTVFACGPPLTHTDIVTYSLAHGADTFSELNLNAGGYKEIVELAEKNGRTAFLSATFLYKKEVEWIIARLENTDKISYRYHTGQYLPDWHPWESYSDFFVANKETSAVREIMSIEFPWIIKAFGEVVDYKAMKYKMSHLDLPYDDTLHLLITHANGSVGVLSFDCVSVKPERKLEVYTDRFFFEWQGTPGSLAEYEVGTKKMRPIQLYEEVISDDQYEDFIVENPYIEEIRDFFYLIRHREKKQRYDYGQDRYVLALIDQIEMNL